MDLETLKLHLPGVEVVGTNNRYEFTLGEFRLIAYKKHPLDIGTLWKFANKQCTSPTKAYHLRLRHVVHCLLNGVAYA